MTLHAKGQTQNIDPVKKMGEFGGQNAHSTPNTACESRVKRPP